MNKIIYSLVLVLLIGCVTNKKTTKSNEKLISHEGFSQVTVKDFSKLDGCGFLLVINNDSTELKPTNLDHKYKKEGVTIWIKYHKLKQQSTTCMKGIPVKIDAIQE